MDGPGGGADTTAKGKEGTSFPLKPKRNGISLTMRFKGEILRSVKINGVLV